MKDESSLESLRIKFEFEFEFEFERFTVRVF